ncbi:MAG: flagellar hook-basal body complex protein FliE [Defluviitaleaceae bacterium]|nr:flagellar hook-basal body complex protein FliE [Defluviitaleaceae bacterium]
MAAITALVNTTLAPTIEPFSPQLQLIQLPTEQQDNPFSTAFTAALNVMNDTNAFQLQAEQAQIDFATGRADDILAVQMAMDRASNALNFTSQITSRIIESYREIMRMQI